MHYYQFNIGDYRKDTIHLSRIEHSIYRDLIDWYYLEESPIPKETQSVMRRLRLASQEDEMALKNVLNDFFELSDDGFRQKRIDQEIADYHEQCEKNRANGKKGGRPKGIKTQSVSSGLPVESQTDATANPNQEPLTSNKEPKGSSSAKLPPCPHVEIIDLFAKHLPELPQPKPEMWSGSRAKALGARWKWLLTAKKRNGDAYATTREEALAWFERYFSYVAASDFLTGRNGKFTGCDLGWLCVESNFAKVLQGNYENKEAA